MYCYSLPNTLVASLAHSVTEWHLSISYGKNYNNQNELTIIIIEKIHFPVK